MRGHGDGTLFKVQRTRPNGTTYTLHVAKISLPDGSRRERSSTSEAKAKGYLREMRRLAGLGVEPRPRLTVAAFLADWLSDLRVRPQTFERYESVCRVHLVPAIGHVRLQLLRPSHVERAIGAKTPRTGQQCRAVLRTALSAAARDRLVEYNAAELSRPVEHDAKPAAFLGPADLARFLEGVADDRLAAFWVLAAMSGMREAELLGLAWDDVNLEAGLLHVRQQLVRLRGEWVLAEPKTRKGRRTLELNAVIVEALRAHRRRWAAERQPDWPYFGLVFVTERGTPIYGWRLVKMLRAHLARLGIDAPGMVVHSLRHSFASHLWAEGTVPMAAIADYLGQSTPRLLIERYGHAQVGSGRLVTERMEAVVR